MRAAVVDFGGFEFRDRHGVLVTWVEGRRSSLYHAVYVGSDGSTAKRALCGETGLRPIKSLWPLDDPSNDLMTCWRCGELVYRRSKI